LETVNIKGGYYERHNIIIGFSSRIISSSTCYYMHAAGAHISGIVRVCVCELCSRAGTEGKTLQHKIRLQERGLFQAQQALESLFFLQKKGKKRISKKSEKGLEEHGHDGNTTHN